MGKRILIDCDPGTDDAIAIVAALYSDAAEVAAITTVCGNAPLCHTSRNALNLCRYLGFATPVAVGANAPLRLHAGRHTADEVHGLGGLGGVPLPESTDAFYHKTAVETIYDEALKADGGLEVVAVGPLTNIAMALLTHPELERLIKRLWIMGGAIRGGNVSTTAEFNIWSDPEAARIVFASGISRAMIGLDVTEQAALNAADAADMRGLGTPAGIFVADILTFMQSRGYAGGERALMHDALALAAAIGSECLEYKRYFVDIECEGKYTFGHTMVDVSGKLGREPNTDVAVGLDLAEFRAWLYGCVANSVGV